MINYPDGYGTNRITLSEMKAKHETKMHPEFAGRFFNYIESKQGLLGVGGGWRATGTQPDKSGFAPEGKSFHQSQTFASGIVGYCAVDLVTGNGTNVHKSPAWSDTDDADQFALHTFIEGEPWHIQPLEIRGWQTWKNAGSPDPANTSPLAPSTKDDKMYTLDTPIRMLDTRDEIEAPLPSGQWLQSLPKGVPNTASAIFLTVTAVSPTLAGFITVWGKGSQPNISSLNYSLNCGAIANTTLCRVDDGSFQMFNSSPVHVIIDVIGYTA